MTAPSNANASGLIAEIDAEMEGRQRGYADVRGELLFRCRDALVTAASAQARIAELERDRTELALIADEWTTEAHERGNKLIATEDRAIDASERAEAAEARADRLAKALERQADNMAFLLNHAPIVQHWYEKFSTELADDRAALQQETQP